MKARDVLLVLALVIAVVWGSRNRRRESVDVDQVLAQAAWNDSILQSYRGLFVTTQSILLAIGTGLFGIAILADRFVQALLASLLLTVLVAIAVYFTWQVRALIVERRQRVNFLVRWLIKAEKSWPLPSRHITIFKFLESRGWSLSDYWRYNVLCEYLPELHKATGKKDFEEMLIPSPPQTFFARDDIYIGILFIWSFLLISSWVYTIVEAG